MCIAYLKNGCILVACMRKACDNRIFYIFQTQMLMEILIVEGIGGCGHYKHKEHLCFGCVYKEQQDNRIFL